MLYNALVYLDNISVRSYYPFMADGKTEAVNVKIMEVIDLSRVSHHLVHEPPLPESLRVLKCRFRELLDFWNWDTQLFILNWLPRLFV